MNTIIVNNRTYSGSSISISNGKVVVDGKLVTNDDEKDITISVEGNIDILTVDACNKVTVSGSVNNIKTQSGDVEVQNDVAGNISTMSGDVDCGSVGGNISTMSGDIKHKRS